MSFYYLTKKKKGYYRDITMSMYNKLSEKEQEYYDELEEFDPDCIKQAKINEAVESINKDFEKYNY